MEDDTSPSVRSYLAGALSQVRARGWSWAKVLVPLLLGAVVLQYLMFRPTPVESSVAETRTLVTEVMGTGTLAARIKATISPKLQGRLVEVLVDQNDRVQAGQLLARLDDADLQRQADVAQAALAATRAGVDRVRADEARAAAVQEQARTAHRRIADLSTDRISSQSDLDKAVEQLHIASADLERSRFAIVEAERQVVTAEKTLQYQQERLVDTRIVSPFAGLVVRRDRDPGDVVVPGGSILEVISTDELWVSAWVDETAMVGLAVGQPARVLFRSQPAESFTGTVARVGRQVDPETREALVDVSVGRLPSNWAVGQRAEVFIATQRAEALTVPTLGIRWRDGSQGVFVHDAGRARWRGVTLGARGREFVQVTEGLVGGEAVVTAHESARPLSDGDRVVVR